MHAAPVGLQLQCIHMLAHSHLLCFTSAAVFFLALAFCRFSIMPKSKKEKKGNQISSTAITTQPKAMPAPTGKNGQLIPFMTRPTTALECPPGLEYLTTLDSVFISQVESTDWFEKEKAYQVISNGFMLYWAQEDPEFYQGQWYGHNRAFQIILTNQDGDQVLRVERPQRFCSLDEVTILTADRRLLGRVEENQHWCIPDFTLLDKFEQPFLKIVNPGCCAGGCSNEIAFPVVTMQNVEVGAVTKHWTSWSQEMFNRAHLFGITFPVDLPIEGKAVLLGACFLIHFRYLEWRRQQRGSAY